MVRTFPLKVGAENQIQRQVSPCNITESVVVDIGQQGKRLRLLCVIQYNGIFSGHSKNNPVRKAETYKSKAHGVKGNVLCPIHQLVRAYVAGSSHNQPQMVGVK